MGSILQGISGIIMCAEISGPDPLPVLFGPPGSASMYVRIRILIRILPFLRYRSFQDKKKKIINVFFRYIFSFFLFLVSTFASVFKFETGKCSYEKENAKMEQKTKLLFLPSQKK